jgi:PAS domain S-box-containing protein
MTRYSESLASTAGVAFAFLILGAIAVASYLSITRYADGARWLQQAHLSIEHLDGLLSELKDAETGQRGFLIAGEEAYLDPYATALAAIPRRVRSLHETTADQPVYRQAIAGLETLIAQRLELLDRGIRAKRRDGDAYDSRNHLAQGKTVMDGIRAAVAEMKTAQTQLLDARSAGLDRDRRNTILIIVIGNVLAFAFILLAIYVLKREARQRQRAERLAHARAAEIEDLYNNAPCGYHSVDRNGVFVRINDTELRWLGYAREELVGKAIMPDILSARSKELFSVNFPLFLEQGWLQDVELEMVRKDGTLLPVLISATAVRDEAGNCVMSRSSVFDITRRRATERELYRANTFLDSVIEHIPDMVFVKDAVTLEFVRFNRAGEELIGYPRQELIGKSDYDFFPVDEADFFVAKDREVLERGCLVDIPEELIDTRNRGQRVLHTKKIPLPDETGRARYLLGISHDITESKQAERRILQLNQALEARAAELEATNKELESFSYSVSHDLRAPLRAIDGFSLILEQDYAGVLDGEGRRLLAVVRTNSKKMGRLIDDLLAFSRLGRQPISSVEVDMAALAREAFVEADENGGKRAVRLAIAPLPSVRGDRSLLRQVWVNLLSNATKYSSVREQPVVEVSAESRDDQTVFRVRDNGVGFDMQYSDKLFGVFQRLHADADFPGTGVGLAIVQRVITRHGGRVWAEAQVDHGATFYFSLPDGGADG